MAKSKKLENLADGFFSGADKKKEPVPPSKEPRFDDSKPKYKGTYVYLTEEQKKRLAMYSVQNDTDNSAVIRSLIDEHIHLS